MFRSEFVGLKNSAVIPWRMDKLIDFSAWPLRLASRDVAAKAMIQVRRPLMGIMTSTRTVLVKGC